MDLHLNEGGAAVVLPLDDATGDSLQRSGVVTAVRLGGGIWEVAPTTKVGVATVAGTTIWVRPKVDIARILFLLGYAKKPGWLDETAKLAEVDDIVSALALAFCDQAERAVEQGLLQGYTEVDDSLTVLRGRVREQEQLRRRFGIAVPLLVRYDDHTADIAENQLLRGATEVLLRLPGVPAPVRVRLRRLRSAMADVTPPVPGARLPTWVPNRLNSRYHVALWLAEVLLRRNAVDQSPGSVGVGGFLVDMAKVFEDFLTDTLSTSLTRFGGSVKAQDRHYLDGAAEVLMKPDLIWYFDGVPAAVVDAKYKAEKPAGFPDADLYQMLAYFTALGLPEGHLVYARGHEVEVSHTVRKVGIRIHAHTLDLASQPVALLTQVDELAARIVRTKSASRTPTS